MKIKKPKNKFSYLFVGVFIGFFIAWSIVWWQGFRLNSDWTFFKKIKSIFAPSVSNDNKNVTLIESEGNSYNFLSGTTNSRKNLSGDSDYYDTTRYSTYDVDALDEFLAMYKGQLPDSLLLDSILKSQNNMDFNTYSSTKPLTVKKDKLIYTKTYTIAGYDKLNEKDQTSKFDSLLIDNNVKQNTTKNILFVEFWKSPINYKGYKIINNKLIIFGLDQLNDILFKTFNKSLYMKYLSEFYVMEIGQDFKPFIPVSNLALLNQLNGK